MKGRIILLFFLTLVAAVNCNTINSLEGDFSLTVRDKSGINTSAGKIYFFNDNLFLVVEKPIKQMVIYSGNRLTVYYPLEEKATVMKKDSSFTLPVFTLFLRAAEGIDSFSEMGMKFIRKEKEEGSSIYIFTDKQKNKLKHFFQYDTKGKLISIISKKKKKTVSKTVFSSYKKGRNFLTPLRIEVFGRYRDIMVKSKDFILSDISINTDIPHSIKNFRLPEGTEIEEFEL